DPAARSDALALARGRPIGQSRPRFHRLQPDRRRRHHRLRPAQAARESVESPGSILAIWSGSPASHGISGRRPVHSLASMKAERRHELQENTLAHHLQMMPLYWQKYGTRILGVIVVILLVIVLINYRIRARQQGLVQAWDDVAIARNSVREISFLDGRLPPEQFATMRNQLA